MSKITNDALTRSGTGYFIGCCTHMATVGVKGLRLKLSCTRPITWSTSLIPSTDGWKHVRSNEIVAARRIRLSEQSGHAINQCRRPSHILAYRLYMNVTTMIYLQAFGLLVIKISHKYGLQAIRSLYIYGFLRMYINKIIWFFVENVGCW